MVITQKTLPISSRVVAVMGQKVVVELPENVECHPTVGSKNIVVRLTEHVVKIICKYIDSCHESRGQKGSYQMYSQVLENFTSPFQGTTTDPRLTNTRHDKLYT